MTTSGNLASQEALGRRVDEGGRIRLARARSRDNTSLEEPVVGPGKPQSTETASVYEPHQGMAQLVAKDSAVVVPVRIFSRHERRRVCRHPELPGKASKAHPTILTRVHAVHERIIIPAPRTPISPALGLSAWRSR